MSVYGPCNFKLVMGELKKPEKSEKAQNSKPKNSYNLSQNISFLFNNLFQNNLPKIKTKEDIHKYILEISKNEDKLTLNEKYICSLYIASNKNLLTEEIINDILEEEFHLTLMKWLMEDKDIVKEKNTKEIYKFNIYIGLLINIITLYEIFPIKSKDLFEFNLYKKLFKLNELIKLNINNTFPFLFSLNCLLNKWKQQINYYLPSKTIKNVKLTGKITKRTKDKENKECNINVNEKDKNDTEADSETKEGNSLLKKNNKKVCFDLDNIEIFLYKKENSPLEYL